MDMMKLLRKANQIGASDLHVTTGVSPVFRLRGQLAPAGKIALRKADTIRLARQLMSEEQFRELKEKGEIDFSFEWEGVSRYRIHAYKQRGSVSLAIRLIPHRVPKMEELGLPDIARRFCERQQGLLLVTGPTGSGKSTTLASMVDYINRSFAKHIITLEDPIEFVHHHQVGIVQQREVGADTTSFAAGLRAALRQDPDVILVGEMRDLETISAAITAAETGHLVLATLHTSNAPQTIDRIIDAFPPSQQRQVRLQLANNLLGVIAQRLLPASDGKGRVAAFEVMANTIAIANLIRQEKVHQARALMEAGSQFGMMTMDQSLAKLVSQGIAREETARQISPAFQNRENV